MHWLLELEINGQDVRWSVVDVEVDDEHVYRAGLTDPGNVGDGAASIRLVIVDPRLDWPTLAPHVQGCTATLRRWVEGDAYEQSVVAVAGAVESIEWDTRDQPVRILLSTSSSTRGYPVPDPLATNGARTFPIAAGTLIGEGVPYPIIFGYPGYEGTDPPYPIVPLSLAEWSVTRGLTRAVCCEDPDAPLTTVYLRNDSALVEVDQDVGRIVDLLGRAVLAVDFGASATGYPATADDVPSLFAGYGPTGGGGPARNAYDVLVYLLRRWGSETVEWDRIPEVRELLEPYQVDTWIDAPVPDPWSWLERSILPDLPVEVRIGARARRYLVPRVWRPLDRHIVGELEVGRHVEPASTFTLERPGPFNEFVCEYRQDRSGVYRARVVMTGQQASAGPIAAISTSTQTAVVVTSGRCLASRARYGTRPAPGIAQLDWTWDEGTALRVLEDRVEREALPALIGRYTVSNRLRHTLREGDVVRLTDDERELDGRLAVVHEPVSLSVESSTLVLRIPQV